ncbi:MAG TPA: hypothetical protein VK551_09175 [Thermodesulfobacteriota bacterium]|nr:hypothetical protein [Thermodesulfobacteriota bacterium]
MRTTRFCLVIVFSLLILLSGCAPFVAKPSPLSFEKPEQCREFLNRLDEVVEKAGVKDASSVSIRGFPYLRANRFLTASKKNLKDNVQKTEWVRWMGQLDLLAREKEIGNLPDKAISSLEFADEKKPDREWLYAQVKSCSSILLGHDQASPDFYTELNSRVRVPDEYSCFLRTVGLYPIVAIPVALVTESSIKKIRKRFDIELKDLPVEGRLRPIVPESGEVLSQLEVREVIEKARRNLLGVPLLDHEQEKKLVLSFAPVFVQDVAASYDCLGRVVWKGERVDIDPEKPTVYYYTSYAFLKGAPILQINYVIWYSERAGKRSPSIERGHLDGLTARVSLDTEGKVFMVDVVSDCGCYHFFVPDRERVEHIVSRPLSFEPFVAQWLPSIPSGERLGIRINSGWHQVQRLISVSERDLSGSTPYTLIPYGTLEALPHEDGWTESIFNSRGIARGSERTERFILFSMGIPLVGSMRQRGHHAIELIGKDHFDNPYLFDQNFVFR